MFGKAVDQSSMTDAHSSYKTTEQNYTVGADAKVAGAVRSSNKQKASERLTTSSRTIQRTELNFQKTASDNVSGGSMTAYFEKKTKT